MKTIFVLSPQNAALDPATMARKAMARKAIVTDPAIAMMALTTLRTANQNKELLPLDEDEDQTAPVTTTAIFQTLKIFRF
jgi:hypothetical protein